MPYRMLSKVQSYKIPFAVKLILKILISILIIFIIVKNVDITKMLALVLHSNYIFIAIACFLFILSKIISAVRFKIFLQIESIQLNTLENLKLYWLGMYYNLLLPGGISGDAYKIKVLFQNFNKDLKVLVKLTLLDRFSGLWALGQIALGFLLLLNPFDSYYWFIVLLLLASFALPWYLNLYFRWINSRYYGKLNLISLGVQLLQTGSAICLIVSMGQQSYWISYSFLFLISSVAAMMPFTFGGAGARELTFLYGSQFLQTELEKAVAIGFLFYLISTFVSFFGILYSFKPIKFSNINK